MWNKTLHATKQKKKLRKVQLSVQSGMAAPSHETQLARDATHTMA